MHQWNEREDAAVDDRQTLPSIEEMERRLLGLILFKPDLYDDIVGQIERHHFHYDIHREIFGEIERQVKAGDKFSQLSLQYSMPDRPIRDSKDMLHKYLIEMTSDGANEVFQGPLKFIPFILRHYAIQSVTGQLSELERLSLHGKQDKRLAEYFERVDELRLEVMDTTKEKPKTIGAAAIAFVDDLNARRAGYVDDNRVLTGLHTLDNHMKGFAEGDLVIIAGRPGMGKTTLATCLLRRMVQDIGHTGIMFSFEMAERQIMARMMADQIRVFGPSIPYNALLAPRLSLNERDWNEYWGVICSAQEKYEKLPIELDTSSSMTIGELMARSRKMVRALRKQRRQIPVIFIDYLKFIKASSRYAGNRVLEVGEITGSLKGLAKELGVPIFLLCQLNRVVEGRQDKRPTLADLRDSGEIEQDADVVIFTYRPGYYEKTNANVREDLYLIIEKNRNGSTGELHMKVDMTVSHVYELGALDHY